MNIEALQSIIAGARVPSRPAPKLHLHYTKRVISAPDAVQPFLDDRLMFCEADVVNQHPTLTESWVRKYMGRLVKAGKAKRYIAAGKRFWVGT